MLLYYQKNLRTIKIYANDKHLANDWEIHPIENPCNLKITYKNKTTRELYNFILVIEDEIYHRDLKLNK